MTLVTLDLPPGVRRAGTTYASRGRWFDTNLARFFAGAKGPIGGWIQVKDSAGENVVLTGIPRGMRAWRADDGRIWLIIGTESSVYVYNSGVLTDITDTGVVGGVPTSIGTGSKYGIGFYGLGPYGRGTVAVVGGGPLQVEEAATWQFDTFGQLPIGVLSSDGRIRYWDLNVANDMVDAHAAAPDAAAVVTTPERFLFALAATLKSSQTLVFADQPEDSETVTIDGKVYTFEDTLTDVDGNVQIGGDVDESIDNLVAAINLDSGAGTAYADSTTVHQTISAARVTQTLVVTARSGGSSGDAILVTTTVADATWSGSTLTGGYGSVRTVRWPARETFRTLDGPDVWDLAAPDTTAGDFNLKTDGRLLCGLRTPRETLLFTDIDLHSAIYIGGDLLYAFERRGDNCGILAPNAKVATDDEAYWMGQNGFFLYDGAVQPVQCEVQDYVFNDINRSQSRKIWCVANSQFHEVWWFYPSAASEEIDRYVVYNRVEKHWTIGALVRTIGVDRGPFSYPIWADETGALWEHERGTDRAGAGTPFFESGPVEVGDGDRVVSIVGCLPDERTLGSVELLISSAFNPTDTPTVSGPYTLTAPTHPRATGRQHAFMLRESAPGTDWRVGMFRFDVVEGGRR
jgi:hypothetical protein